jgi:hypothetical protein
MQIAMYVLVRGTSACHKFHAYVAVTEEKPIVPCCPYKTTQSPCPFSEPGK